LASSWLLFFSYHNDARPNKHQITNIYLIYSRTKTTNKLQEVARAFFHTY